MNPAAPRAPRRSGRLRVLVLLLTLLVAGAPVRAQAAPAGAAPGDNGCPAVEHDVPDSAVRSAPRHGRRPAAPPRPAPSPAARRAASGPRPAPRPPRPPHTGNALRRVVLRC
ncbi:hypothetical protein [Streptomyces sp. NPDC052701]|uniref:hypothetical protein n=1 Tax=Streptomyces sp. NPDC052701 TaxID=3155533 RepID=UPI003422085F